MKVINQHRAVTIEGRTVFGFYLALKDQNFSDQTNHYIYTFEHEVFEVDFETVCKNSEVMDYKGEFIYQNDAIVSAPNVEQDKKIGVIRYHKGAFWFIGGKVPLSLDTFVSEDRTPFLETLGYCEDENNKTVEL